MGQLKPIWSSSCCASIVWLAFAICQAQLLRAQSLPSESQAETTNLPSDVTYELERLPPIDSWEDLDLSETDLEEPTPVPTESPRKPGTLGGLPGKDKSPLGIRTWWIPNQDVKGQPGQLSMNGVALNLAFPVSIGPDGIWLAMGGIERLEIQTPVLLPDSGMPVPDELWNIQFGTMHFRELDNGWRAGGMAMLGSPSDRPFESTRDMTVTILGFLTVPSGDRDAWNFSLMYSPTGQLTFPIPGLSYVWKPSENFVANLGVPFSLHYEPNERWSIDAGYTPLTNGQVMATRKIGDCWSMYGGYRTVNETFLLAERIETNERFYIFDQRLLLGLKRTIFEKLELDFSVAYAFDRKLFQAEQYTSSRRDQLNIDPGLAGMLQLGLKR